MTLTSCVNVCVFQHKMYNPYPETERFCFITQHIIIWLPWTCLLSCSRLRHTHTCQNEAWGLSTWSFTQYLWGLYGPNRAVATLPSAKFRPAIFDHSHRHPLPPTDKTKKKKKKLNSRKYSKTHTSPHCNLDSIASLQMLQCPHLVDTDTAPCCSPLPLQASDTFSRYMYLSKMSSGARIPKKRFSSCTYSWHTIVDLTIQIYKCK